MSTWSTQEGEEAWLLLHQQSNNVSERLLEEDAPSGPSIADLADDESRFIDIGRCSVHYKFFSPEVLQAVALTCKCCLLTYHVRPRKSQGCCHVQNQTYSSKKKACIMLIHGFGGGVFSWRHVMKSLVKECCCPVLAFDRPGFGLVRVF